MRAKDIFMLIIVYAVIYAMMEALANHHYQHGYMAGSKAREKMLADTGGKIVKSGNVLKYPFNPKKTADILDAESDYDAPPRAS